MSKIDDWQQVKRDKKIIAEHQLVAEPDVCHTKHGDYIIDLSGNHPSLWPDSFDNPIPIKIVDYDFNGGKIVHYWGIVKSQGFKNNTIPEHTVLIDAMYTNKTCTITFFDNSCSGSGCTNPQDGVLSER